MISVTTEINWCMAHRLVRGYEGPCNNIHGHNYKALVTITGEVDDKGMIIDFKEMKNILNVWIISSLDHTLLIDTEDPLKEKITEVFENSMDISFLSKPTTAEHLCAYIAECLQIELGIRYGDESQLKVMQVTVFETEKNSATWTNTKGVS